MSEGNHASRFVRKGRVFEHWLGSEFRLRNRQPAFDATAVV
jgi:hypothetical protein